MDELESTLQSLQALKAPGVTPTKVKAITAICVENIQVCRLSSLLAHVVLPFPRTFTKLLFSPLVRLDHHPEDPPAVSEQPCDTQARCTIRCRLGHSPMGRKGQGGWANSV